MYKFEKLVDMEIGHRDMFETYKDFDDIRDDENANFYRRKQKAHDEFQYSTEKQLVLNNLFGTFESLTLVKKYDDLRDDDGNEIYSLIVPKMFACEEFAEATDMNKWFIYRNFPKNIKCTDNPFHHCEDCLTRTHLIHKLNRKYNLEWSLDDTNFYLTDHHIKRNLTLRDRNGKLRPLNSDQRKLFSEEQYMLKILDEHYRDKQLSIQFWRNLLNNIPQDSLIIFLDHMSTVNLGANLTSNASKDPSGDENIIPLGVVICFSDLTSGETKRLYRLLIPDSTPLTSLSVISGIKKLLTTPRDPVYRIFYEIEIN